MIRVNLLKASGGPGERIQAVLNPGGPSAFISKREIVLAALFVVLGGVILATQLRLDQSPDEGATTEIAGAPDSPDVLLSRPPSDQAGMPRTAARPAVQATPGPAPEPEPGPAAAPETAVEPPPATPTQPPRASTPPPARPATAPPRADTPAPRPRAAAAVPSSAPSVTGLRIEPRDGSIEISLRTGSRQEYSTFRLDNPNRVVIDLNGLGLDLPRQMWDQQVDHPLLKRLRIALNRPDPPRVRMVLEVSEFPLVMPVLREDGLTLRLSPAAQP